jgi:hypothetical protein
MKKKNVELVPILLESHCEYSPKNTQIGTLAFKGLF